MEDFVIPNDKTELIPLMITLTIFAVMAVVLVIYKERKARGRQKRR